MDFHNAPQTIRAFIGGNRSGKTTAGVVEDLWWLTGEHPYLDVRTPVYGRIAAQDLKVLKKVVIKKIEEWCPRHMIAKRLKGQYGFIQQYEFKNGSILDLMSYEMDVDKFEGVDLDFVHFDEPPPEAVYNASRARLIDRNGHVWFTLTPLDEPWIYDKVYLRGQDNPKRYKIVEVEMRDNPYLSRAGIKSFEDDMDDEELRQRAKGEFAHLSGKVIKGFKKAGPYVIESRAIPPSWRRFCGIDPHDQKPIACVWMCLNSDGQLEVYDELYDADVDTSENLVARINEVEGKWQPEFRVMDNSANKKDRTSGLSLREDLTLRGITTTEASKTDRSSRIIDLKGRFKLQPTSGEPRIIIQEHCIRTIYELQRWTWEKVPSRSQHRMDASGKTVKKDDDIIDAIMYVCGKIPQEQYNHETIRQYDRHNVDHDEYEVSGTAVRSYGIDSVGTRAGATSGRYGSRFERARSGVY